MLQARVAGGTALRPSTNEPVESAGWLMGVACGRSPKEICDRPMTVSAKAAEGVKRETSEEPTATSTVPPQCGRKSA